MRVRNYLNLFLKNYITSEGAVFHNGLYYQQLSIAHYQVSFYAYNYFEKLPIVSIALKKNVLLIMEKRFFCFFFSQPTSASAIQILGDLVKDKVEAAKPLIRLFHHHNMVIPLIKTLVQHEVSDTR